MTETGKSVPKRLRKEPLLEAIWEIRFTSDRESVAELLPGLIYKAIDIEFPKIERLPAADLPSAIVQQDAKLRYVPTKRLEGSPYSIQIGEHVVSLSCRRPYTGWGNFETKIMELAEILKATSLVTRPERFSLKYIDIISLTESPSLKPLRLTRSALTGPFNIGSEEMVAINRLADMIMGIAGKQLGKKHIPGPLGVRGRNSDNRLIAEKLGWKPTLSLEHGLRLTYAWIKEQVDKAQGRRSVP